MCEESDQSVGTRVASGVESRPSAPNVCGCHVTVLSSHSTRRTELFSSTTHHLLHQSRSFQQAAFCTRAPSGQTTSTGFHTPRFYTLMVATSWLRTWSSRRETDRTPPVHIWWLDVHVHEWWPWWFRVAQLSRVQPDGSE